MNRLLSTACAYGRGGDDGHPTASRVLPSGDEVRRDHRHRSGRHRYPVGAGEQITHDAGAGPLRVGTSAGRRLPRRARRRGNVVVGSAKAQIGKNWAREE